MRAKRQLSLPHQPDQAHLDTDTLEQESGIVRRERANQLLRRQLEPTTVDPERTALSAAPANAADAALADESQSADFEGEFWDTAPVEADANVDDFDVATEAGLRPVVSYSPRRRLAAIVAFAIVFSATVALLYLESAAWLLSHG